MEIGTRTLQTAMIVLIVIIIIAPNSASDRKELRDVKLSEDLKMEMTIISVYTGNEAIELRTLVAEYRERYDWHNNLTTSAYESAGEILIREISHNISLNGHLGEVEGVNVVIKGSLDTVDDSSSITIEMNIIIDYSTVIPDDDSYILLIPLKSGDTTLPGLMKNGSEYKITAPDGYVVSEYTGLRSVRSGKTCVHIISEGQSDISLKFERGEPSSPQGKPSTQIYLFFAVIITVYLLILMKTYTN